MRKGSALVIVIIVIAAIVILVGGWWVLNRRNQTQAPQSQPSQTNTNSNSNSSQAPSSSSVSIANMAFSPTTITVKKGATVTWTNNDKVTHNVTANDKSFSSGSMAPGKSYSFTFDKTGSFAYTCTIHPDMKATVVVTD